MNKKELENLYKVKLRNGQILFVVGDELLQFTNNGFNLIGFMYNYTNTLEHVDKKELDIVCVWNEHDQHQYTRRKEYFCK